MFTLGEGLDKYSFVCTGPVLCEMVSPGCRIICQTTYCVSLIEAKLHLVPR